MAKQEKVKYLIPDIPQDKWDEVLPKAVRQRLAEMEVTLASQSKQLQDKDQVIQQLREGVNLQDKEMLKAVIESKKRFKQIQQGNTIWLKLERPNDCKLISQSKTVFRDTDGMPQPYLWGLALTPTESGAGYVVNFLVTTKPRGPPLAEIKTKQTLTGVAINLVNQVAAGVLEVKYHSDGTYLGQDMDAEEFQHQLESQVLRYKMAWAKEKKAREEAERDKQDVAEREAITTIELVKTQTDRKVVEKALDYATEHVKSSKEQLLELAKASMYHDQLIGETSMQALTSQRQLELQEGYISELEGGLASKLGESDEDRIRRESKNETMELVTEGLGLGASLAKTVKENLKEDRELPKEEPKVDTGPTPK